MGNMQRQGISPEMYFQITGTTQEDLHKQYEADADKRVKTNLVIEAVAAAEGLSRFPALRSPRPEPRPEP